VYFFITHFHAGLWLGDGEPAQSEPPDQRWQRGQSMSHRVLCITYCPWMIPSLWHSTLGHDSLISALAKTTCPQWRSIWHFYHATWLFLLFPETMNIISEWKALCRLYRSSPKEYNRISCWTSGGDHSLHRTVLLTYGQTDMLYYLRCKHLWINTVCL
jgi:hypothetical protein